MLNARGLLVCVCDRTKRKSMQYIRGKLHIFRKLRKMTQKQVAHLIGHSDTTMISKYERGLVVPTLRTALKLTILYRMPIQETFACEFSKAGDELAKRAESLPSKQAVLF